MVELLMVLACCCYGEPVVIYCLNFTRDIFIADYTDSSVMGVWKQNSVGYGGRRFHNGGCWHVAGSRPPQATPFPFASSS